MRLATNNFERKLLGSESTIEGTLEKMGELSIDVLICTEPGQATRFNENRLINLARAHGGDVKLIRRARNKKEGG